MKAMYFVLVARPYRAALTMALQYRPKLAHEHEPAFLSNEGAGWLKDDASFDARVGGFKRPAWCDCS